MHTSWAETEYEPFELPALNIEAVAGDTLGLPLDLVSSSIPPKLRGA